MSAAEHLAEAINVGCSRDDHDHVGDHRREVLAEAIKAATAVYEQGDITAARSPYNEGVFDAVSALYRLLKGASAAEGKGTGTTGGEPTPTAGIADERALKLADHILNAGGVWTSGKAHRWLSRNAAPVPSARFTRRVLKALAAHGYLTERHEPGRISYTPNYAKDGS